MIENIIFPAFWDKLPLAQPVHVWEVVVPVGATNITFYCKKSFNVTFRCLSNGDMLILLMYKS